MCTRASGATAEITPPGRSVWFADDAETLAAKLDVVRRVVVRDLPEAQAGFLEYASAGGVRGIPRADHSAGALPKRDPDRERSAAVV